MTEGSQECSPYLRPAVRDKRDVSIERAVSAMEQAIRECRALVRDARKSPMTAIAVLENALSDIDALLGKGEGE